MAGNGTQIDLQHSSELTREERFAGCILGTALGDALGLKREGLSRARASRIYGDAPLEMNFFLGQGYCSDDTEHTVMLSRALIGCGGDLNELERRLASDFKVWLLAIPAGIGLATLRSIVKLWVGFGPERSGVSSAGNGPAMRSAILGLWAESEEELRVWVKKSTRLTHTDPRAEEGAYAIALATHLSLQEKLTPAQVVGEIGKRVNGEELRANLAAVEKGLCSGLGPKQFAETMGWHTGVSGYINQTVPCALYCWAEGGHDFRRGVENAVMLGGDSDSVAAITGAVAGANLGDSALPQLWLERLGEWPRDIGWMRKLAKQLAEAQHLNNTSANPHVSPPRMLWPQTLVRNLLFTSVVLGIAFRRLLPPY